jgi:redox-sensitive bicupin YhaK (pirin superfamily)
MATSVAMSKSKPLAATEVLRPIVHRVARPGRGPIARLMSPSDLGEILKPFVFLDFFDSDATLMGSMPMHPHSGIATVTLITQGDVRFSDPHAGKGVITYGGVEWMRAGGGVWHGKEMSRGTSERLRGFQLWISLPPELENGPVDSQYLEAPAIPTAGPARVILGEHQGFKSPVRSPHGITYLLVTLAPGQSWRYQPPPNHEVLWLSVSQGALHAPERVEMGTLAIFAKGNAAITLQAHAGSAATFILGSAVPHPYDLKLGYYSVHTSDQALQAGEAKIEEIRLRLQSKIAHRDDAEAVPIFK